MIITISGKPGSGKNTIANILADKLGMKRFSVGDFRRKLAKQRGMTINELNELGEKEAFTDNYADEWQIEIGRTETYFIIDGRLSYFFIPNSLKIFLDSSPEIGAMRIIRHGRMEESFSNISEAIEYWHKRIESDIIRYKKYYNLDPYNLENFDFVLDTSDLNVEEVVEKVLEFIEKSQNS